jgi:hypothetical protein
VLVYTVDVEDPNIWDAAFYDALAWSLAAELALTLGNDPQKAQYLTQLAAVKWEDAKIPDSRENQDRRHEGGYVQARR